MTVVNGRWGTDGIYQEMFTSQGASEPCVRKLGFGSPWEHRLTTGEWIEESSVKTDEVRIVVQEWVQYIHSIEFIWIIELSEAEKLTLILLGIHNNGVD